MCRLLVWQFFSLFAQFKTKTKSHENYVFLYPFSKIAMSPKIMKKMYVILVNCMGWQVCYWLWLYTHLPCGCDLLLTMNIHWPSMKTGPCWWRRFPHQSADQSQEMRTEEQHTLPPAQQPAPATSFCGNSKTLSLWLERWTVTSNFMLWQQQNKSLIREMNSNQYQQHHAVATAKQ